MFLFLYSTQKLGTATFHVQTHVRKGRSMARLPSAQTRNSVSIPTAQRTDAHTAHGMHAGGR